MPNAASMNPTVTPEELAEKLRGLPDSEIIRMYTYHRQNFGHVASAAGNLAKRAREAQEQLEGSRLVTRAYADEVKRRGLQDEGFVEPENLWGWCDD